MAYFADPKDHVATSIFPICPVDFSTGFYYEFLKGDLARDNVARKPAFGKVSPAKMGHTDNSYKCVVDQIIVGVDQIGAINYQRAGVPASIDPRRSKVRFVSEQQLLHLDILFAESFFKTGVWANEFTGISSGTPSGSQFLKFNDANFDPVNFFDARKREIKLAGRRMPNKLSLGYDSFTALKNHPDTFRALHPLMTIIAPDLNNQFINSLIKKHQEGGIYPMWDLASNYTGTMIGYHAVPVIVDAYMKGYRNFDAKEAYKACLRAAEYDTTGIQCPELVLPHLMPKAKYYKNSIGYIPCDRENESVAKALEYAYDDWCISIFAEAMNDFESKAKYERFAKAYEFYFDKSTRFMRGLDSKGEWRIPFNPRASTHRNDDYCEGTAWQWTWFVPHDVDGLVNLMGGEDAFAQKLDSLFTADSSLEGETTSSDISGLIGQYAHGNEPSHHVIHLYNYVNRPWRTQELVDSVYRSQYANSVDGLSGNEDCGQMSAWYVLNSMGFYQVCPGKPVYSIGRPVFDKAVINLPEDKTFSIIVKNNSKKNKYIESISLNGESLNTPFFNHQDIANGGTMEINMSDKPNNKTLIP